MSRENEGATVEMLLRGFHLPTIAALYEPTMVRAETEGWSHRRVLEHLCQSEAADREQRRIGRLLAESGLPEGKTLGNLDEALLPAKIRRQLPALLEGGFVSRSTNILAFGLPGRGKTHFLAALGRELILRHSM
ncbi:MAG: ATP-binding protein, partial [Verrucomicrobiae bacterium]